MYLSPKLVPMYQSFVTRATLIQLYATYSLANTTTLDCLGPEAMVM
jgi:hypothetical protein